MSQPTYQSLGDYLNGEFVKCKKADGEIVNYSPADLKELVFSSTYCYDSVDKAMESAKKSFTEWAKTPLETRIEFLNKLKKAYLDNTDRIAESISRETGKPRWEAVTEAKALAAKIDVTIQHSLKLVEDVVVENALPHVSGVIRYKPRGVMSVIGPFNFPAHLPNGHIVPALLTGNTVVFKPSEKTPMVGQIMAEMINAAGFPKGVFNLVQGDGETGKRLAEHEWTDGVLFTGSYDVGLRIKQATLHHYWKLLALEMGGKNTSIVWKDAKLKKAVYECLVGSYLTSGQRCSCTSKIVLHSSIKDQFIDNFYQAAKKLKIGYWNEDPFMGPLISESSVEKYLRFQEIAKREDAECLMRGKVLELDREGHYVTPSINLVKEFNPKSVYQNSEIFGPNVGIFVVDDYEEAIEIVNSAGFGLVASLFSDDRSLYEKALLDARVGLLNWNRTTNGASSKLPFGGMGKSGNDRPSAHFAVNYCTVPVASLEDLTEFDAGSVMPGIKFEMK